ncbi:twitching motility protein PilT [Halobaculum sp. CBA1158]|uniref:PIN domain-containing protein n=1 Tax=Halobaculum sp. CBA1158 TaxID=2904243 RepID=UPI001F2BAD10|nr:PIN domain-containing protein [Halobaculum sp. CBA1158]UIP01201.1 twitching motility protein PilT [Halobaculum sp. CBA1158]
MVVLDTNALMMPVECDVRVFEELDRLLDDPELVTPEAVVAELEKLAADGSGAEATAASVGHDLVERCRVVATTESYADDAVVELASGGADSGTDAGGEFDGYVVTNDRPLRERLLARGVRVIGLRGANTLAVTEP